MLFILHIVLGITKITGRKNGVISCNWLKLKVRVPRYIRLQGQLSGNTEACNQTRPKKVNSQNLDWKGKITNHVCCYLVFDGIARGCIFTRILSSVCQWKEKCDKAVPAYEGSLAEAKRKGGRSMANPISEGCAAARVGSGVYMLTVADGAGYAGW
eukprot:1160736-Pelagomonas_calceolata.AAC.14